VSRVTIMFLFLPVSVHYLPGSVHYLPGSAQFLPSFGHFLPRSAHFQLASTLFLPLFTVPVVMGWVGIKKQGKYLILISKLVRLLFTCNMFIM
jgi:hypothetical protein